MRTSTQKQWMLGTAAALALVFAPAAIAAQAEHTHEHAQPAAERCAMHGMSGEGMMGSGMMMGGMADTAMMSSMMTAMQFTPQRVLTLREDLTLADDQVARLEALVESRKDQHQQMMRQQAEMHAAMLADAQAVRALLTEAQRDKLVTLCPMEGHGQGHSPQESEGGAHSHQRPPA
jgi:hypothetical protein